MVFQAKCSTIKRIHIKLLKWLALENINYTCETIIPDIISLSKSFNWVDYLTLAFEFSALLLNPTSSFIIKFPLKSEHNL